MPDQRRLIPCASQCLSLPPAPENAHQPTKPTQSVQYVSRRLTDASSLGRGEIIGTTRDVVDGRHVGGTDDPFEFQLLRGNAILGLDVAVQSMAVGERARFVPTTRTAPKATLSRSAPATRWSWTCSW